MFLSVTLNVVINYENLAFSFRTRTDIVLINWMNTVHVDVYSDPQYRYAILLAHLYPDVHFYAFTPDKMNLTQELFKNETGIYR